MDISDRPLPPGAWRPAQRAAARLVSPIQRFLEIEAASGILLLLATVVALLWANSAWSSSYGDLWHTSIGVQIGSWSFVRPLHFWVNDGLMTIFFFVVGLEIRREMYAGELAGLRKAALPIAAALGGMLVPAAIYALLNGGRAGASGWGIAMATDIAFAVGVLTLLGSRVPANLRLLLLALAVIDDIGAIIVIAVFYTPGVDLGGLVVVGGGIAAVFAFRAVAIRSAIAYLLPGVIVWIGLYRTGIHPTLAGVVLGLLTPVVKWSDEAESPAEWLQHHLHAWVAYAIMPMFALANAGVELGGADLGGDGLFVFLGIVLGLAVGKPLGIFAGGAALRGSAVPARSLLVVGIVGGIGFTMSLFVAQLAFPPGPLLDTAKLAILVGSGVAIVAGLATGVALLRRRTPP